MSLLPKRYHTLRHAPLKSEHGVMSRRVRLWASAGLVALGGCTSMSSEINYSTQSQAQLAQVPHWQTSLKGQSITQLTDLMDSPQLHQWIQQALAQNPGLQNTLLTLRQAQLTAEQAGAAQYPEVSAGFSGKRSGGGQNSGDNSSGRHPHTEYTGSVSVSWTLDIWRQVADQVQAAEYEVTQQAALYRSARATLTGEVMSQWLGLIADSHALDIEHQRLATLEKTQSLVEGRYRQGLSGLESLESARSATSSSQARLVQYQNALEMRQRALNTLLGRFDATPLERPADYPEVALPHIPNTETTLRQRPDLQAAYQGILAADRRTAVAYKDLLPSFSLQAALQQVADSPREALLTDPVWSLLGQLTAPLFQGGRLRAQAEIQTLITAQRYQDYRETLLTAIEDVRNALAQEVALGQRQTHIRNALDRQKNSLALYENRYRNGVISLLDLLNVQQQTYDLQAQWDQLTHDRLSNRINLALALGIGVDP